MIKKDKITVPEVSAAVMNLRLVVHTYDYLECRTGGHFKFYEVMLATDTGNDGKLCLFTRFGSINNPGNQYVEYSTASIVKERHTDDEALVKKARATVTQKIRKNYKTVANHATVRSSNCPSALDYKGATSPKAKISKTAEEKAAAALRKKQRQLDQLAASGNGEWDLI